MTSVGVERGDMRAREQHRAQRDGEKRAEVILVEVIVDTGKKRPRRRRGRDCVS